MLLTVSYLESAYPIIPVEPLKPSLYDYFVYSVYNYIHISGQIQVRNSDSILDKSNNLFTFL